MFKKKMGKVISCLNQKGGVGKTTMTFQLALLLKERNYKVLCLDCDPQGNLSHLLHKRSTSFDNVEKTSQDNTYSQDGSIFNLLINSVKELKALHTPASFYDLVHQAKGIDYIKANQDLSSFDLTVAGINALRQLILKRMIKVNELKKKYDYILIDGPPTLGLIVVNIICACDGVLIPFMADDFSRNGLMMFHEILEQVEEMEISPTCQVIGHIPNLVDTRRKATQSELSKTKDKLSIFDHEVFKEVPNSNNLLKAQLLGKGVTDYQNQEMLTLKERFTPIIEKIEQL